MVNQLNFNNVKKQYLTITLADEKKTVLMVGTPTKAVMDEIIALQSDFDEIGGNVSAETLDSLYRVCAKILSRNKAGTRIESEYLAEILDFEDIMLLFNAYVNFVEALGSEKN